MARLDSALLTEDVVRRFWAKVDTSGDCWEWMAARNPQSGYGVFGMGHSTYYAHRVAYILSKGMIPDGEFICHSCDNRGCVRPSHLFPGTNADNMRDMVKKGRNLYANSQTERDRVRNMHSHRRVEQRRQA